MVRAERQTPCQTLGEHSAISSYAQRFSLFTCLRGYLKFRKSKYTKKELQVVHRLWCLGSQGSLLSRGFFQFVLFFR